MRDDPRERDTLVPCPACNAGDVALRALEGDEARASCGVCAGARLVSAEVLAEWQRRNPPMGRAR